MNSVEILAVGFALSSFPFRLYRMSLFSTCSVDTLCFFLNQDSSDAVRFLVAAVSIFGPQKTVQKLIGVELDKEKFLIAFNEIFIPWCLRDCSASTGSKLDFLLAIVDSKCFMEQWHSVITFAINTEGLTSSTLDSRLIQLLAMLMEKARERMRKENNLKELQIGLWQHKLLDSAAISVVNNPPCGTFGARFLRYADDNHF